MNAPTSTRHTQMVARELRDEIEHFLLIEAELLDDWKFRDWLGLLSDDVEYLMRTTTNAQTRDRRKSVAPPTTWIFNDGKFHLERRVARLETGMAWAEEPPSRTRHLITNLRVRPTDTEGEYEVRLNYLLYRAQKERDETFYAGMRLDRVRKADSPLGWVLCRRETTLDQVVVNSHNLSVFF
ncbi:3-phenylpropionate/cinnamic acid dioxygenase subunit beta [Crenobacter sp. SG2303]|uniref:3-phenylpropionate/cinnamic acid dioxygenase subunit beta n=1 Tax=Crenobacter oryzisoli TaxID=3056844 RepID=A0ABT7XRI5_9NEIS|nr:3-phenylpropionate/cinnamic acid dioxygenase subunit beta [Crenobacter sp. SG2303]MDN0076409.1 3-phenylpropionate/cinnamic acid dioxygenase subunit beta [Crenobacter sp. SG2303]